MRMRFLVFTCQSFSGLLVISERKIPLSCQCCLMASTKGDLLPDKMNIGLWHQMISTACSLMNRVTLSFPVSLSCCCCLFYFLHDIRHIRWYVPVHWQGGFPRPIQTRDPVSVLLVREDLGNISSQAHRKLSSSRFSCRWWSFVCYSVGRGSLCCRKS